jgi:azurin
MAIVARLLPQQLPQDLKPLRARIDALTVGPRPALVRQYAWATLATADESFDSVWKVALAKSPDALVDVLAAVPLTYDPATRFTAQGKVLPLLAPDASTSAEGRQIATPVSGRFVRLELPRRGSLAVAEVEITSNRIDIARAEGVKVSQSSMSRNPELAIDGSEKTYNQTRNHSGKGDDIAWLEIDLGSERPIDALLIWPRTGRKVEPLNGLTVKVLDAARHTVFAREDVTVSGRNFEIAVGDVSGDVRRAAIRAAASISNDAPSTFAALASLIERGEQVPTAAAGLRALPRNAWDASRAPTMADALLAWASAMPAEQRTSSEYLSTVQFTESIVSMLPADRSEAALTTLRGLRVPFFVVGTVREQMRYDTTRLIVEAGKPFEIRFENSDMMPHNLTVLKPNSRERVGKLAQTMKPNQLDAQGRAYLPQDDAILGATKLLEPGQTESLKMTAPADEGDYDYVCTYPEHWQVMWGKLIVTKDVDAYLKSHPENAPPAASAPASHQHH